VPTIDGLDPLVYWLWREQFLILALKPREC
jgi:hypothetical protein